MEQINLKAKVAHVLKNTEDNCYELGFADDRYDYENYILFQRPIKLDPDDDPEAEENGIFAECNENVSFSCVKRVVLTDTTFEAEVANYADMAGYRATVDLTGVKVDKKLTDIAKAIFGELIRTDAAR